MKTLLLLIISLLLATMEGVSQNSYSVKSSKVTIQGTSSLHDWESEVTKPEVKGVFSGSNGVLTEIKGVEVKVIVTNIKSTKGKTMDNKTYEAFKYEKNPHIVYKLTNEPLKVTGNTIEAKGNLTMAGVTKLVDLTVKVKKLEDGSLQLSGSKKMKMTEFKMEPPTAMMGTIKVGDEVAVNFTIILNPNNK